MQLNRFTDYGLRVLIYLCSQAPGQRVSLDFLATRFRINKHHLHKISQRLSRLGWIDSARGKNGGISLRESSRSLTLATIIGELEPEMNPIDCAAVKCPLEANCRLQTVLDRATIAFMEVLATYRLEDLRIGDLALVRLLDGGRYDTPP